MAVAVYGGIIVSVLLSKHTPRDQASRQDRICFHTEVVHFLSGLAGVAAVYFIGVQWLILGKWCVWCTAVHGCGLIVWLLIWWQLWSHGQFLARTISVLVSGSLLTGYSMILSEIPEGGFQITPAPTLSQPATNQLEIDPSRRLWGGRISLTVEQYPHVGPSDAAHVWLYVYDYTCPHCRVLHEQIKTVRETYGEQMVIVLLPLPMESACNELILEDDAIHQGACELAKLSLLIWRESPQEYEAFHDWLMTGMVPPLLSVVRERAQVLVGDAKLTERSLEARLAEPWLNDMITRAIGLYRVTERGALPKLIGTQSMIAGRPGTAEELRKVMAEEMRITNPPPN